MARDGHGRVIDTLRLSVTDRCNYRCAYCLPADYAGFAPREETLTDDETLRAVETFAGLGFRRVRVTGGEPLVRPRIVELVRRIAAVPGVSDLSMSTNGALLSQLARPLADAGLRRVNLSLDTLDPVRFARLTRFGELSHVLSGLDAAERAGLFPLKVNVVVVRGVNEDEIPAFAALADRRELHVRFIELMPMGDAGFYSEERRVPLGEMLAAAGTLERVAPADRPEGGGPARVFRRPGARGTLGFISALSCGFCDSCNRVRLTARGVLHPCLDATGGSDLRPLLRAGAPAAALRAEVEAALSSKPRAHAMAERAAAGTPGGRLMCQTGG